MRVTENNALDSTSSRFTVEFDTYVTVGKGKQSGWQIFWGLLIAGSIFAVLVAIFKGRFQAVHGLILCLWIPLFTKKYREAGSDLREKVAVHARLECLGLKGWRLTVGDMVYLGASADSCSISSDGFLLFDAGTQWVKVPVDMETSVELSKLITRGECEK